jgi:nuclear pore complex protein Nup93
LVSNYLLAQAHVDAPTLASSIAHLNTAATFTPLQPLQDTDIAGYLRHAHEQSVISTIEEARRETRAEFYRALEDRSIRDWEARKKRVFEELGGRVSGDSKAVGEYGKGGQTSRNANNSGLAVSPFLSLSEHVHL